VEPDSAACMGPSLAEGRPVSVATGQTIMSGLNCGSPSSLAWPLISNGLDSAVTVSETTAIEHAHRLAEVAIAVGPCVAASLAGVPKFLTGHDRVSLRRHLGVDSDSVIVLTIPEGADANPVPDA